MRPRVVKRGVDDFATIVQGFILLLCLLVVVFSEILVPRY